MFLVICLLTVLGRNFHVAGMKQWKACLANAVLVNGSFVFYMNLLTVVVQHSAINTFNRFEPSLVFLPV